MSRQTAAVVPIKKPEFYIEKNVPLLPTRRNRQSMFPFAEMKVGDSFFAKDIKATRLSSAARQWGMKHQPKWKFAVRTVEGGSHIWRFE